MIAAGCCCLQTSLPLSSTQLSGRVLDLPTVNSLRAISSRRGRARWSADQEQHQALLEDDELIDLDEFMLDDFERFRVYGTKLEA